MKKYSKYLCLVGLFCMISFTAMAAQKIQPDPHHDKIMNAVVEGLIQPFSALQDKVETQICARIIKVDLDDENGDWIYKIRLIDNNNNIINAEYNARTLALLQIKGRDLDCALKVTK